MDMRKERKMEYKWTVEWPNEEASYWFYGCLYKGEEPKLYYIECWGVSNGNMLVANGNFWSKTEAGPGIFAKIDTKEILDSIKIKGIREKIDENKN